MFDIILAVNVKLSLGRGNFSLTFYQCGLDFYMICIDFCFSMLLDKAACVCL